MFHIRATLPGCETKDQPPVVLSIVIFFLFNTIQARFHVHHKNRHDKMEAAEISVHSTSLAFLMLSVGLNFTLPDYIHVLVT